MPRLPAAPGARRGARKRWTGTSGRRPPRERPTRRPPPAAQAEIRNAEALLAAAEAGRQELRLIARRIEALEPQAPELAAARDRAALAEADRTLRMPLDGVVSRVFADPGEHVLAGQRIVMVHDPSAIRIEADAKQTELRHFRIGAPVRVTVDARGWHAVFFLSLPGGAPQRPSAAISFSSAAISLRRRCR